MLNKHSNTRLIFIKLVFGAFLLSNCSIENTTSDSLRKDYQYSEDAEVDRNQFDDQKPGTAPQLSIETNTAESDRLVFNSDSAEPDANNNSTENQNQVNSSHNPSTQNDGIDDNESDEITQPIQIIGAFLTFDNARINCDYSSDPTKPSNYTIQCKAYAADAKGNEVLATSKSDDFELKWNAPVFSKGQGTLVGCQLGSDFLSNECTFNVPEKSAEVVMELEVSNEQQTRKESEAVLLPYEVRVAAGFLPLAPYLYQNIQDKKETKSLGLHSSEPLTPKIKAKKSNLIKANQLISFDSPIHCATKDHLYFSSGRHLYKASHGNFAGFELFAGSKGESKNFQARNRLANLRLLLSPDARLICTDKEEIIIIDPKMKTVYKATQQGMSELLATMSEESPEGKRLIGEASFDAQSVFATTSDGRLVIYNTDSNQVRITSWENLKTISIWSNISIGRIWGDKLFFIDKDSEGSRKLFSKTLADESTSELFELGDTIENMRLSGIVSGDLNNSFAVQFSSLIAFSIRSGVTDFIQSSKVVEFPHLGQNKDSATQLLEDKNYEKIIDENITVLDNRIRMDYPNSTNIYTSRKITIPGSNDFYIISTNLLSFYNSQTNNVQLIAGLTAEASLSTKALEITMNSFQDILYDASGNLVIAEKAQPISKLIGDELLPILKSSKRVPFGNLVEASRLSPSSDLSITSGDASDASNTFFVNEFGSPWKLTQEGKYSSLPTIYETIDQSTTKTFSITDAALGARLPYMIRSDHNGGYYILTKRYGDAGGIISTYDTIIRQATAWLYHISNENKLSVLTTPEYQKPDLEESNGKKLNSVTLNIEPSNMTVLKDGGFLLASKRYFAKVEADLTIKMLFNRANPITFKSEEETLEIKGIEDFTYIASQDLILFPIGNEIFQFELKNPKGTLKKVISKTQNSECASTYMSDKVKEGTLSMHLSSSISQLCRGRKITKIASFDECQSKKEYKVAFSQTHAGNYSNLIEFTVPCR